MKAVIVAVLACAIAAPAAPASALTQHARHEIKRVVRREARHDGQGGIDKIGRPYSGEPCVPEVLTKVRFGNGNRWLYFTSRGNGSWQVVDKVQLPASC